MFNHQKVERILRLILESLVYFSFLMPFVYVSQSIFPFIVGKILYFQGLVQIMFVVYILLLAVNFKKYKPQKTLLLYWFYFYAATLFLSAVFGIDFDRSFWSNFERMTGVFVVYHFITYSIIISVIFNSWKKIKVAIQALLVSGLLQLLVVGAQYVKPGVYLYPNVGGRVWGTLGNSIYIGSYFLFHIFFALLLAVKEKKQIWQIIYICIAFLEGYTIIHSGSSSGADLAILFALVFIFLAYGIFSKIKFVKISAISIFIAVAIFIGGALIFKDSAPVKAIPRLHKLVNISLEKSTGKTRLIAWEIAIKSFKERPILGWGLENFYYVFNKYYNPESLLYSYYETWFDRSHSIVFDTLSSGGIVGMISYFGLFVVGGIGLFLSWRKSRVDEHILIFFIVIFATYLIQLLVVFDHPASYLFVYFAFGLLLSLLGNKNTEDDKPTYQLTSSSFWFLFIITTIVFLILFFNTSIKTYKTAVGIIDAERAFVQDISLGIKNYQEILSLKTPFIDDARLAMAKRIANISESQLKEHPDYKSILLYARDELLKQVEYNTKDVYDYIILGQIDTLLSILDSEYLKSADNFFVEASKLSPKRQQIYYTWAKVKILSGDWDGAIAVLEKPLSFDDRIADSYWYLGMAYQAKGDDDIAWDYFMQAIDKKYTWKANNELGFLIGFGQSLGKDEDLLRLYLIAIDRAPSAQLYAGLGSIYSRLGDKLHAIEAWTKAQELDPNLFKQK